MKRLCALVALLVFAFATLTACGGGRHGIGQGYISGKITDRSIIGSPARTVIRHHHRYRQMPRRRYSLQTNNSHDRCYVSANTFYATHYGQRVSNLRCDG